MCDVAPLAISGWETVLLAVLAMLGAIIYGELRARDAARWHKRHALQRSPRPRPHDEQEDEGTVEVARLPPETRR